MKRIGLIGGMSFESGAVYYRLINEMVREASGSASSADIMMHSLNCAEIAALKDAGEWTELGERMAKSAAALEKAGAECVLICSNTMHKVADEVKRHLHVPLFNIIDTTADALKARHARKPLLLATRCTLEDGFYVDRMARLGIEVIVPDHLGCVIVNDVIKNELRTDQVLEGSRGRILDIISRARAAGADSVVFASTELGQLVGPKMVSLPIFDSMKIHAAAAAEFALSDQALMEPKVA